MAVDYGEADQVLKSGEILYELNWNISNNKWLDCIYSFKTYFNAFLRYYLNGKMERYGYILDHYDVIFSQTRKESFAKENDIDTQLLNDLFKELNKFALNTHTIGNYMPCPDKDYNSIKGFYGYKYFQDRLDLLYIELLTPKHLDYSKLNNKRKKYKKWLDGNKKLLHIEDFIKNDGLSFICKAKKQSCIMNDKEDLKNFFKYLQVINSLIIDRGLFLQDELRNKNKSQYLR